MSIQKGTGMLGYSTAESLAAASTSERRGEGSEAGPVYLVLLMT